MTWDAPIIVAGETVPDEWIDYNGHMNVAYYLLAFDHATDVLFDRIGLGVDYMRRTAHSTFTRESHVNYLRELGAGDPMRFSFQLLDHDHKRMHYFGRMLHADNGYLAATSEWLSIHVSLETRRSAEMSPVLQATLGEVQTAHRALTRPDEAGRAIGLRRGKAA